MTKHQQVRTRLQKQKCWQFPGLEYSDVCSHNAKDINNDLRSSSFSFHKSGEDYMTISKENGKSHSTMRKKIFRSEKYSIQFLIFPGIDVPSYLPKAQTVQCSEKLKKKKISE